MKSSTDEHPRLHMALQASIVAGSAIAVTVGCALLVVACGRSLKARAHDSTPSTSTSATIANLELEVAGRTRSITRRVAFIAPVPLHQVVEVLVSEGDRVKKG